MYVKWEEYMRSKYLVLILFLLLVPGALYAVGTTGKLKGIVKDKANGNLLMAVNVVILNENHETTHLGAATDEIGGYFIINIPPGKYTVQFSMIGYAPLKVENVRIIVDFTTQLSVELTEQSLTTGEVVVTAEREIIQHDMTATVSFTSAEQIINMPVNSFTDLMNTTAGILFEDGIHLRGGRAQEIGYYLDGFYIDDALYGGQGADVARLGIQELSILTGTFNAEYGGVMSGIVNIVTPEGGSKYHGSIRVGTDKLIESSDWGSSRFDGSLSGPVPGFGDKLTFFMTADHSKTLGYTNETNWNDFTLWADTYDDEIRFTNTITIRPTENMKFKIGSNHSRRSFKLFRKNYRDSDMFNFTWTQTLSKSTYFDFKGSWFESRYLDALYDEFDPYNAADLSNVRSTSAINFTDALIEMFPQFAPFAGSNYEFSGPFMVGPWYDDATGQMDSLWVWPTDRGYQKNTNTEQSFMFNITSQVHSEHMIRAGAEYRMFKIKDHYLGGINEYAIWDSTGAYGSIPDNTGKQIIDGYATRLHYSITDYKFSPKKGAFYIQDKMEFEDMIVNLGLRLDFLDVNAQGLQDPEDLSSPYDGMYEDKPMQWKLSPRLGFGYPITDQAVLHFAYGHFIQFPDFDKLYRRWNRHLDFPDLNQGYEPYLGNPSLKPEKTRAYELGAEWMLADNLALDITLYSKNIYDFIALERIAIMPGPYWTFINMDYGNARGIEFSLNKGFSNHWSMRANYTYSRAEGNADNWVTHFWEYFNAVALGRVPPKSTDTMSWDQPHTINFVFDIRYPGNWGANFVGQLGSGFPYTKIDARGKYTGKVNNGRKPKTGVVNMRLNKDFSFSNMTYTLWADVINLFNRTNINNVFPTTGLPGYTTSPNLSLLWMSNPQWYNPPRHVELGRTVNF
jgi:outer membrane receptor protein involved in Fe transport